jgi:hypothetical protein
MTFAAMAGNVHLDVRVLDGHTLISVSWLVVAGKLSHA